MLASLMERLTLYARGSHAMRHQGVYIGTIIIHFKLKSRLGAVSRQSIGSKVQGDIQVQVNFTVLLFVFVCSATLSLFPRMGSGAVLQWAVRSSC